MGKSEKSLRNHRNKAFKPAAGAPVEGGNLKFPKPSQSQHVEAKKDNMSHNVGGNEHLGPRDQFGPSQKIMESGAGMKNKIRGDRY